jgi:GLPGLI family protein
LSSVAQEIKGGMISYEQIIDYQLEGAYNDPAWDSYIDGLPKQGKIVNNLYFTTKETLYEEDFNNKQANSSRLTNALKKVNFRPKEKVQQVYIDLEKTKVIEQVEFMTRSFRVISDKNILSWKLTPKKKKVLDYVCMGAELDVDGETLTAWFTPEIPISAGPAKYHGLPGMILGLEKNGAVFLLATAVNLTPPEERLSERLEKGQEFKRKDFNEIKTEKIEEFWQSQKSQKAKKGKNE